MQIQCPCTDAAWLERGLLVELLLQPLIGVVDAQLLKAVLLKALKAIDIQDAEGQLALALALCQGCVDAADQVAEEGSIDGLCQRISA